MENFKTCNSCFVRKPFNLFYKESKVFDGHKAKCKECMKFQKHLHYENNKNKYKKAYQEFIKRNPDYQKNTIKKVLLKMVEKNFKNIIKEIIIDDIKKNKTSEYFKLIKSRVKKLIDDFKDNKTVKVKLIITSEFNTPLAFDIIEAHYQSHFGVINSINDFNTFYDSIDEKFNAWVDKFQDRGSGHVFNQIIKTNVKLYKTKTLRASSYIPLLFKSKNIVNVKNQDNKCFIWSILSKLFPAKDHVDRLSNYLKYEDKLNMDGIEYPVRLKDIPKFEKQNNISIYVFALGKPEDKYSLYPIYTSTNKYDLIIDLLYLEQDGISHYCAIKNLESLLADKSRNKAFICRNCMCVLTTEEALNNHQDKCLNHKMCKTILPSKDNNILEFTNHHFKSRLPIVFYCDFESNNKKLFTTQPNPNEPYENKIFKQELISYGMYIKSDYPNLCPSVYTTYTGENAKEKFVETIITYYNEICRKLNYYKKAKLTHSQEKEFNKATNCYICNKNFEEEKVREHNHYNGKYRGASCQSCNTKEGKSSKIIPVFFHNGSGYDFHFIIDEIIKYENKYDKLSVLAKTSEEYISFEYGNYYRKLRFLDSYRFFTSSLDGIVKSMDDFKILKEHFPENFDLLKRKGVYPYEYVDSIERLKEEQLPPTESFYSTLKKEGITEDEYQHAVNVWNTFQCKTLQDYHDLYLKTDVLLLADAFEKFRSFFLEHHEIDPCYCFSAPGLTWQCGLKHTGIKLELLTDPDMVLMFEKGIRGGYSGVLGPRYVKANNKYLSDYDPKKRSNYLLYLDANNLYGGGMSESLPVNDFKWEKDIPKERGYIIECDLEYTVKAKTSTSKFPLAPEKLKINEDDLSDLQKHYLKLENKKVGTVEKLMLNLKDKKNYVIHYKLLDYFKSLGLRVSKVHKIISFEEKPWLKKYIDFNTQQRTLSKSDFEKNLWKLMNNAFYGKTLENIRGRIDLKLVTNKETASKLINKPNFRDSIFFNENLIGIANNVTSIKFNKPIYLGMCVLDYSKLVMYKFYYDVINTLWQSNEIVGFDTDSYFLNIRTEDVYKDMDEIIDDLDTSDYPIDHFLHSTKNKKVINKFKDELNGKVMSEIIFLRSKAYTYKVAENEIKKLKGITKTTINKDITFDDYKNCLFNKEINYRKMNVLNSDKHEMYIKEINKKALSPYDDKRYILDDGIKTIPYSDQFTNILYELANSVNFV